MCGDSFLLLIFEADPILGSETKPPSPLVQTAHLLIATPETAQSQQSRRCRVILKA